MPLLAVVIDFFVIGFFISQVLRGLLDDAAAHPAPRRLCEAVRRKGT